MTQQKAKLGRPASISPEKIEKLTKALKAGSYIDTAAAYAGIHKTTFYNWLNTGSKEAEACIDEDRAPVTDLKIYVDFFNLVSEAIADAETRNVLIIANAAKKNPSLACWMLERRNPKAWSMRQQIEQKTTFGTQSGTGKITFIVEDAVAPQADEQPPEMSEQ